MCYCVFFLRPQTFAMFPEKQLGPKHPVYMVWWVNWLGLEASVLWSPLILQWNEFLSSATRIQHILPQSFHSSCPFGKSSVTSSSQGGSLSWGLGSCGSTITKDTGWPRVGTEWPARTELLRLQFLPAQQPAHWGMQWRKIGFVFLGAGFPGGFRPEVSPLLKKRRHFLKGDKEPLSWCGLHS